MAVNFLHTGRNAWHSTWVKRYENNCLFADRRALDKGVEQRSSQGTVFYNQILPAFQLRFENRLFVIVNINNIDPFMNFNNSFGSIPLVGNLDLNNMRQFIEDSGLSVLGNIEVQEVLIPFCDIYSYQAAVSVFPILSNWKREIDRDVSYGQPPEWYWTHAEGESKNSRNGWVTNKASAQRSFRVATQKIMGNL